MKRMHALAIAATLSLAFSWAGAPAFAQTHPEYVKLPGRIQGALYRPDSGRVRLSEETFTRVPTGRLSYITNVWNSVCSIATVASRSWACHMRSTTT